MGRAPRWSALLGGRQSTGLRGSRIEVEAEPRGLLILCAAAADDAPYPAHAPLVSATGPERARLAKVKKKKKRELNGVSFAMASATLEKRGFRPRHMLRIGRCGSETTYAPGSVGVGSCCELLRTLASCHVGGVGQGDSATSKQ